MKPKAEKFMIARGIIRGNRNIQVHDDTHTVIVGQSREHTHRTSWWQGVPREGFTALAWKEWPEMRKPLKGRGWHIPMYFPEVPEPKRKQALVYTDEV